MKRIIIAGANSVCEQLIYYISEDGEDRVVGAFDDFEEAGSTKFGVKILGSLSAITESYRQGAFDQALIAIGYRHLGLRESLFNSLRENQIPLGRYIHPTTYLARNATVGAGSIILLRCTIAMSAVVAENVFVGSQSVISHSASLGAHSYLSPAVKVAGNAHTGKRCFLGINATLIDSIQLGDNVTVAAGAVVIHNAPANVLLAGVPARIKREIPSPC